MEWQMEEEWAARSGLHGVGCKEWAEEAKKKADPLISLLTETGPSGEGNSQGCGSSISAAIHQEATEAQGEGRWQERQSLGR